MSENKRRMLIALAHPDDESFGMAGTIAKYADEGAEVYLICATNGDIGTADEHFLEGHDSIASLRLRELACAAEVLKLTRLITFGYRDSGMSGTEENKHPDCLAAAQLDEVTRRISEVIRDVKPQVVVTFDPYGGYGHPDHIKMYEATTAAFHMAADPNCFPELLQRGLAPYQSQKLYYMTFDRRLLKVMIALMPLVGQNPERIGKNQDINLREIAIHSYPIHARINTRPYTAVAEQASQCHASQLGGWGRPGLVQRVRNLLEPKEDTYMRVVPPAKGRHYERDLFSGVTLD
jgi:LmbE family N-acetylglucosaminyl deacetylase